MTRSTQNLTQTLALTLALVLPAAAQAGTFDITGQKGGTMAGTWTCLPVEGVLTCTSQSLVTSPDGATGTRERSTLFSDGTATSTLSGTRNSGRSFSRTSNWQR